MACGEKLDLSLNEVETSAGKAARGAGLCWAEAEAAGRAARWLACRNIDWAPELLELLEREDGREIFALAVGLPWQVGRSDGQAISYPCHSHIHWLLPAICAAAMEYHQTLRGDLGDSPFAVDVAGGLHLIGLASGTPRGLTLTVAAPLGLPWPPVTPAPARRSAVAPECLARLEVLVQRTYVPTSEKSRLRGARAPQT